MTFVLPEYKPASGRRTIDGVVFKSYKTGILRYCQITEDGRIRIAINSMLKVEGAVGSSFGSELGSKRGRKLPNF